MRRAYERMTIGEIEMEGEHSFLADSQSTDSSITSMHDDEIEVEPFICHEFPPVSFQ
ncbi:MAG: hypothetical protein Q4G10_00365 [Bacteroidia bacterium]|nr:hypothetical protein [Bacteroidia bacterium]